MYTDICNYKPQLARAHIFHYNGFSTTQTSETLRVNNFHLVFTHIFFHNIVYSTSPVYNNLNGPGVNIKGPCSHILLQETLIWY